MSVTRHFPPRLARRHLARRDRIEPHDHDRHQLLYPAAGVIEVTTVAGSWVIPPLRAIWLPAGCPHSHAALGPAELHSVLLPARDSPLDPARPTLLQVSPLLREVLRALTTDPPPPAGQRGRLAAVALDQLCPAPASDPFLLPVPADPRLRAIVGILRDDPADPRTLAELGRAVGSSERTLSRLYQAGTGMSFRQWRAQLRLQAALIDLAAGDSVAAVAGQCGYSTPSAFVAAFRQALGMTPGAYRQAQSRPC
jgi:AraC-like DNA-binding protein